MSNRIFARIQVIQEQAQIAEIIAEIDDFEKEWMPDFVAQCIDITTRDPMPEVGWIQEQNGDLVAPAPYVPPPPIAMMIAAKAGCTVNSTGTPALNATFDAVGPRWQQMRDEVMYIMAFDEFSGGLDELDWVAKSGDVIFTTTAQFKTVVKTIGDWLTKWQRYVDGKIQEPPASTVTIA